MFHSPSWASSAVLFKTAVDAVLYHHKDGNERILYIYPEKTAVIFQLATSKPQRRVINPRLCNVNNRGRRPQPMVIQIKVGLTGLSTWVEGIDFFWLFYWLLCL